MTLTQLEDAIRSFSPIVAWHSTTGSIEYLCAVDAIHHSNGKVSALLLDKNRKTYAYASLEYLKIKEK